MGKIEKNMYVRTSKGKIRKFEGNNSMARVPFMIKCSYNIIDLIEVGDILLIKDFVDEACTIFTDVYYIQNENQLFNIKRDLEKNKNMKISKILTKEQFESMAYEVEQ